MILAELEVFHSRPFSPTRRVALGYHRLPTEGSPGFGTLLLGGIVAAHIGQLDADVHAELFHLTMELEQGRRIPQPRLRHRFQTDRVGLARSHHRLIGGGEQLSFAFDTHGSAAQQILAAVYAGGQMPPVDRQLAMEVIRIGMHWRGPIGPTLIAHLTGREGAASWSSAAFADPIRWALQVLEFDADPDGTAAKSNRAGGRHRNASATPDADANGTVTPTKAIVQRRFRDLLRRAHPDHGGESNGAAQRIADLTEARRILLRS